MVEILAAIGIISFIAGIIKFFSGSNAEEQNASNDIELTSDTLLIGEYSASQFISDEEHDIRCSVSYNKSSIRTIVGIDGRRLNFKLLLTYKEKEQFVNLLKKSIEWANKALSAKLEADKELGVFTSKLTLQFNEKIHYVDDAEISLKYICNYTCADVTDECMSNVMISTPKIDLTGNGDVVAPCSIIFISTEEINTVLRLISDDTIQSLIDEQEKQKNYVDEILN